MSLNCSKKFVRYLDNYNKQHEHIYSDCGVLSNNILMNYSMMYPHAGVLLQSPVNEIQSVSDPTSIDTSVPKTKRVSIDVNIKNIVFIDKNSGLYL